MRELGMYIDGDQFSDVILESNGKVLVLRDGRLSIEDPPKGKCTVVRGSLRQRFVQTLRDNHKLVKDGKIGDLPRFRFMVGDKVALAHSMGLIGTDSAEALLKWVSYW